MRSFLLLLALSAAPAVAQDASPLDQAEERLKAGKWTSAAEAAAGVLDDPAAMNSYASAWRTMGDALVQGGYPYAALVAYAKGIEIAPVAVSPSYGLVLPLAEPVDEDVWIGSLVGKDLGVPMDASARPRVSLLAARAAFDAGSWGEALALAQLVGRDDPAFLEAEVLRGVTLAQQNRYGEAIVPMATAYESARAANKDDHYVATLALNTARTFFASGNFGQAMAYYDKVPRSDAWWPTAQYERAWAHFRVDDIPGTLALLITHQSPFFEEWYFPEADLLRAQALYLMCKFPETSKVMNAFKDHYQPVLEGLGATVGQLDATTAYDDAVARLSGKNTLLPEPFMRRFDGDDRLADASAAIKTADAELARLGQVSSSWASRAATALQARRDARVAVEGSRILDLARDARADLADMLQSIELTQVDLLTLEARLYDQAAASGAEADLGGADRIRELRRKNKRVWPFQGEYWMDELGHYGDRRATGLPREPAARPLEAFLRTPIHTSRLPLPDGGACTLVTARLPGAPASVYLRFDAGAADEGPGEFGAAHVLEHMLFKGTPTRGVGEAARAIEALGGDLNAWTSHDELVLHAEVAGAAWREVVDVIGDMVLHATLDAAELARELPVVLEEIASYEDDPDEQLSDAVQAALWPEHAYGRPVTGRADDVRTLDVARLAAFRARELTAGRATWVVVADADHEEVAAVIGTLLTPLGSGLPRAVPASGPPRPGVVRPLGAFDDRALELSWRAPPPDHDDHAPLHVLSALLSPSSGDRIAECLDAEPKVGFAGWSEIFAGRFGSSVSVGFRPLPGRTAACLERVRELIARLGRHAGGRLVGRARDTLLADLDFAEQTTSSIAEDLLFQTAIYGDPTHRMAWRDALAAVTPEDVARVARTWLQPEDAVIGVLDADTGDDEIDAAWRVPTPPSTRQADEHLHGCRVLLSPTDVPVAAVRILVPGGALRVPPRLAGLGSAWSRTVHRGAGRYDGEALHDALDDLAADLQADEGSASLSLSVTAPAHHLIDVIRLLGEIVLEPHLDDEEWALVRDELVEDARTRLDRPRQVLSEATQALRFPGHPWSMRSGGTTVTLGRIGQADLRRFHDQHFVAGALTVAVVGGMDPDEVRDALSWLEDLPKGSRRAATQPWPALTPGIHTVHAGTRQATIAIQGGGVSFREPSRRGLELAAAVLDGQGGRLFLDLRERRGLAYELWAQDVERAEGGWFEVGLATDPARLDEASAALHEALRGLITTPPTEAELTRARAVVWGRRVLAGQRVEHHASRLAYRAMWGRTVDAEERRLALDAVTPSEVAQEVEAMLAGGLLEVRCLPRTDRT